MPRSLPLPIPAAAIPLAGPLLAAALLLAAADAAGAAGAGEEPAGTQAPIAVTTDSAAYCRTLAGRVDRESRGAEAARLAHEGIAMCRDGNIRGGIIRLRRALMIERDRDMLDD